MTGPGLLVTVTAVVCMQLFRSVTETVYIPAGKPETEYTYGLVPPDAATVVLYAVPAVAPGNEAVEMDNELVVVPERNRLKVAFAVCMVEEESVTVKPIEYVPPVAGKPMIASHLLVMLRPLGRPVAVRV